MERQKVSGKVKSKEVNERKVIKAKERAKLKEIKEQKVRKRWAKEKERKEK